MSSLHSCECPTSQLLWRTVSSIRSRAKCVIGTPGVMYTVRVLLTSVRELLSPMSAILATPSSSLSLVHRYRPRGTWTVSAPSVSTDHSECSPGGLRFRIVSGGRLVSSCHGVPSSRTSVISLRMYSLSRVWARLSSKIEYDINVTIAMGAVVPAACVRVSIQKQSSPQNFSSPAIRTVT